MTTSAHSLLMKIAHEESSGWDWETMLFEVCEFLDKDLDAAGRVRFEEYLRKAARDGVEREEEDNGNEE